MKNEYISIIMSCYNEKVSWLKESIESILNQTYSNFEFIIIIDNPKNFEIIELVKKYSRDDSRIRYIINEKNLGLVKSLNKAIECSSGEFIARMDADDISREDRIERQLDFMLKNPEIALVGTCIESIDENGKSKGKRSILPTNHIKISKILPKTNFFNHPTWFVRREVYISLGGYRDINKNEDYDFLLRALSKGYKLSNLNEHLLKYRERNDSISRSNPLEQYIATMYSKKMYRERCKKNIDSYSQENFNKFIDKKCDLKSRKSYDMACEKYSEGIAKLKARKNIKGTILIIQSMLRSKYQLYRTMEFMQYKIELKINN